MSETLMECDEHGVALPAPEEKVLYRICIDGEDDSPLTEVMTLEAHQALINLLLTPEKGAEFQAGKTREL